MKKLGQLADLASYLCTYAGIGTNVLGDYYYTREGGR